jgi:hypothetical protein
MPSAGWRWPVWSVSPWCAPDAAQPARRPAPAAGQDHDRLARHHSRDRDRVRYVSGDATHGPAIHEAWADEVDQTRILVRTAASPFGDLTRTGQRTRWLHQHENFVAVKGQGFV